MRRKACVVCGRVKSMKVEKKCCSHHCAGILCQRLRSPAERHRNAVTGGLASGVAKRARAKQKILDRVAQVGVVKTCQEMYRLGYENGIRARRYYEITDGVRRSTERQRLSA